MYDKALAAKFGDSIERVYRKCDEFVGEVMSRVDPTTPILIVSDHGFHSFRQSVNLNTWLVQEGFMAIQGQQPGEKTLQGPVRRRHLLGERRLDAHQGLRDGARSDLRQPARARRPRHRRARRLERVQDDLAARLLTMTDPKTGARMVDAVYKRDDIYTGAFLRQRVGAAGRPRRRLPRLVAVDARRLAAGHRLSEHEEVVGRPWVVRLQADRRHADLEPSARRRPARDIMDIAPTVLKYFGVPIPSDIDGKPIF